MVYKTREKLIEVARQLFVHKGLENTTMSDIANASEKGRRTIYTYFKNKKEIYNAVLERESDDMVSELKQVADSNLEPELKLRKFLKIRLEQGTTIGSSFSAIKALFKFDIRRMERIRRMVHDKEYALLRSILAEGVQSGVFDDSKVELFSRFATRCIQGMDLCEIDSESAQYTPQIQSAFIDFITEGITNNTIIKNSNIQPFKLSQNEIT